MWTILYYFTSATLAADRCKRLAPCAFCDIFTSLLRRESSGAYNSPKEYVAVEIETRLQRACGLAQGRIHKGARKRSCACPHRGGWSQIALGRIFPKLLCNHEGLLLAMTKFERRFLMIQFLPFCLVHSIQIHLHSFSKSRLFTGPSFAAL